MNPMAFYKALEIEISCQPFFAYDIKGILDENEFSAMGAATSKPARRGRPPLKSGEAKRASFNTRLRNALKEHLEESAREAGRSLSEEIETRLERSFDRAESLGGLEYEALFQMMAAAARVIEMRLGKSPFSDPQAAGPARYAWREIIDSLTPSPNEAELVKELAKEQDQLMNDISNMKLPKLPNLIEYSGIERDAQFIRFQNELLQYERKLSNFIDKIYEDGKPLRELGQVGKEAVKKALSLPKHR
jgi:predicted HicB family RNase H-like nuclease